MTTTDLKEVVIPQVGVRYQAKETFKKQFSHGTGTIEVYGSDSMGWKVWVTIDNRSVCINPKNASGEMLKYKESSLAIAKANHFLTLTKPKNLA